MPAVSFSRETLVVYKQIAQLVVSASEKTEKNSYRLRKGKPKGTENIGSKYKMYVYETILP